jgi:hypothetical protein
LSARVGWFTRRRANVIGITEGSNDQPAATRFSIPARKRLPDAVWIFAGADTAEAALGFVNPVSVDAAPNAAALCF